MNNTFKELFHTIAKETERNPVDMEGQLWLKIGVPITLLFALGCTGFILYLMTH